MSGQFCLDPVARMYVRVTVTDLNNPRIGGDGRWPVIVSTVDHRTGPRRVPWKGQWRIHVRRLVFVSVSCGTQFSKKRVVVYATRRTGAKSATVNNPSDYDHLLGGKNNFEADRRPPTIMSLSLRHGSKPSRTEVPAASRPPPDDRGGYRPVPGTSASVCRPRARSRGGPRGQPEARVAYVDDDPLVVPHAQALLAEPDRSVAVRGDLREPAALLEDPAIRGHLDFGRPVAAICPRSCTSSPTTTTPPGSSPRSGIRSRRAATCDEPYRPPPSARHRSGQGSG